VGAGSKLQPTATDPVRHRGTDFGPDHAADSVCHLGQQEGDTQREYLTMDFTDYTDSGYDIFIHFLY
jgi:hypothetical protein